MTFLELEKECKKRRVRKFLFVSLFLLLLVSLGIYFYEFNKSPKIVKKNIKEINKSTNNFKVEKREVNLEINTSKKVVSNPVTILKPVINIDVNMDNTFKQKIKKDDTNTSKKISKKPNFILENKPIPSFEECLKKAEYFYKIKEYKKAIKWAKYANSQNINDKRPWIINAKALFKLNQKDKAIKILEIYYSFKKDKEVENLIKKFKEEN